VGDKVADIALSMTLVVFLGVSTALWREGLPPTVGRFSTKVMEVVAVFEEQFVEFAAVSTGDTGPLGDGISEREDIERWCSENGGISNSIRDGL